MLTNTHRYAFLKYLCDTRKAQKTTDGYGQSLDSFIKFSAGHELSASTVLNWQQARLQAGCKPSSVNLDCTRLGKFFGWAVNHGLIKSNPMPDNWRLDVEASDKRPMEAHEMALILTAAEASKQTWWPLAVKIAWHTGLRLSDAAMLKNSSIDKDNCCIRLTPMKTKRKGKVVEIPLPCDLARSIQFVVASEYVQPRMAEMYQKDNGASLSADFSRLAQRAGVEKTFHSFRHGFITRHIARGVSPAVVAELCGVSLNTIMAYVHTSLEDKRRALEV